MGDREEAGFPGASCNYRLVRSHRCHVFSPIRKTSQSYPCNTYAGFARVVQIEAIFMPTDNLL